MVGYFMEYRCHQKLKRPCAYQNLIYFMALCKNNSKIYAFLEKRPHFENESFKQQYRTNAKWGRFSKRCNIWKWSSEFVLKQIKFWYADGRFSDWNKKFLSIAPWTTLIMWRQQIENICAVWSTRNNHSYIYLWTLILDTNLDF